MVFGFVPPAFLTRRMSAPASGILSELAAAVEEFWARLNVFSAHLCSQSFPTTAASAAANGVSILLTLTSSGNGMFGESSSLSCSQLTPELRFSLF